jgi:hypothetical protein
MYYELMARLLIIWRPKGQIGLRIGENSPHEFLVVENLPMDCEVFLRQDWLKRFG